MVPLLALSLVSVTLCLERAFFWLRHSAGSTRRYLPAVIVALRDGDEPAARAALRGRSTVFADLVRTMLDLGRSEASAVEAVEEVRPRLERFMPTLSTIITAAPLLGILGTVTGIISSFELLSEDRLVSDPKEVSGGIAEALITTAAGLVVALITLFPYAIYRAAIDRAYSRIDVILAAAAQKSAQSRAS